MQKLDDRHTAAGIGFRAWHRFVQAKAPLLAAGTTYYLFLSLISLVAAAYGTFALFGADQLSVWLTDALNEAFPGLIGVNGISPESIRNYGTAASITGLVVLAIAGTAAAYAANQSLHLIFGAPKDPRNIVVLRLRMLGMMLLLGPLILLSFVPSLLITTVSGPVEDWLGLESRLSQNLLWLSSVALSLCLNYLVIYLVIGWLGGICPPTRPRRIGAASGAVAVEVLKLTMANIISWSLSKPQYGAFAVPITIMLLLYLLSFALYVSACLTAAIAIKEAEDAAERSA